MEVALQIKGFLGSLAAGALTFGALALLGAVLLPGPAFTGRFWLFLLLSGVLGGVAYHFSRRSKGVRDLGLDQMLKDLASGDLTLGGRPNARQVMDAYPGFQRLLHSFQGIIGYLQDTAEGVSNASNQISEKTRNLFREGKDQLDSLTEAVSSTHQLEGDIGKVMQSVNTLSGFTEKTSSAILQMRASIDEVVGVTHNLSSFMDEVSSSIEEMARSVEEVAGHGESLSSFAIENASAMVEMDATIGQIHENIKETEGISRHVSDVAQTGVRVVKETVGGLEKIQTAMKSNLSSMNSLGQRSKEIGKILKVIREIADQTNLLALNAAIIAAQAGEHGKSFGVVAEEIRDLSERTTASTAEVGAIITTIQREVESAQKEAQAGMGRVEEGVLLGRAAEENLQRIKESIELAGKSISHIARAASEQAKGSRQVTTAIEEMTKRIERISVATREQARTAHHISGRSMVMKDLTRNVDRAMQEESAGSNTIADSMEQVRTSVDGIQRAMMRMSQAGQRIATAMDVIRSASEQNVSGARELASTSSVLRQDALLVVEDLRSFSLPKSLRGGELRVGYVKYEFHLDPAYANNLRDHELTHNYCEGLVKFGYGTRLLPGMAESWTISTDSLVYTFRMRKDAVFHNGRRITASDVLFAWHRSLSPKLDNEGKWFLSWVVGVDEYMAGKAPVIEGLKALDDRTVEVRLREPLAFFLSMLTTPESAILPRESVDERTLKFLRPIGCGPFVVTEAGQERIAFERFSGYHDPEVPCVDRMVFDYESSTEEELSDRLKDGRVHLVSAFSNDHLEKLLAEPFWENHTESTVLLNTMVVTLRNDLHPTSIKEVRQAMNYAVDRDEYVSQYSHTKATPARGILPPGILGYKADRRGYYYDPEKARWLLSRAGFGSGLDLPVAVDVSRVRQLREFTLLVEMLARVGIRIEAEKVSHEEFEARRRKSGRPLLYSTGWYADYPDPDGFIYVLFDSKAGDVLEMKYNNPKLDDLAEKGRRSLDVEERIAIYEQAEDLIIEDAPCILLYHTRGTVPHRPELQGLKLSLTPPIMRCEHIWLAGKG